MKKVAAKLLIVLFLLALAPTTILAQSNNRPNPRAKTASSTADLKTQRQGAVQDFKAQRASASAEFKARLKDAREDFKTRKETIKDSFQAKLALIRNENKKLVAGNLLDMLNAINERRSQHFADRLEQISKVLEKISSRKDKVAATGKNLTSVETAIASASAAIASAETSVASQSAKTYTINFSAESNLKTGAQTARNLLKNDLKLVHDQVVAARRSVVNALQALVAVSGGPKQATSSANTGD
jgi:NACalpha-BTF3-like transcription factor